MPDDDYTPLHARFQDDERTVEDVDAQDVTPADVERRVGKACDAAEIYLQDLKWVRRYLRGDVKEKDVWAHVTGLPSKGVTGEDVDVVQYALGTLRRRAERVRRLTADADVMRTIEQALRAMD